ncbi:aldehyde dehydrogenase family protein [Gryllotalpicola koreensis]|uniref:DhaL domain-containing protein n=1 Tax=Gryllotalpicola koreensis TaxID=993086 RepID=A0ABP8A9Y3_9MICO
MTALDATLRSAFDAYKRLVDEAEPLLTALDERSGDGDFGANLQGGLSLAASHAEGDSGSDAWAALAKVFLDDVGGTSGPLFGLLFRQLARAAAMGATLPAVLADGTAAGLAAIQRVGEAQLGDRTLVDALAPAVEVLRTGGTLATAVTAAVDGAIATRELVARRGRASYVGERAVGSPDPGAVGIALMFTAFGRSAGEDVEQGLDRLLQASASAEESTDAATDALAPDSAVAIAAAHRARRPLAGLPLTQRADLLDQLAATLEEHSQELVAIAEDETHLSTGRLSGEVVRTAFQLRMFADLVRDGGFLDARIDPADPSWPVAPRPELRRSLRPVGPVLVFAASNFPFAFSVLGGDTASALGAGNPVVVKAHPGHPRLSRRVAELAITALAAAGAPEGIFALIEGQDEAVAALRDPRIAAAAFTGSIAGGRALFDIAQSRPVPIPFYGELGSSNPVFVTPAADADDAEEIAAGFIASFTLGAGQFCTKPGTLFVPSGSAVLTALERSPLPDPAPLLNDHILTGFRRRLTELIEAPGVTRLRSVDDPFADVPGPILLRTHGDQVLANPARYLDECFGPAALVVEYGSDDQLLRLAEVFDGQLTATVFGTEADSPRTLLDTLAERAGRLLWCQWPTGVAVTDAQQHGGPYPASTASQTTSVGTAAIVRFLRPVALQGFPGRLLPAELRDA